MVTRVTDWVTVCELGNNFQSQMTNTYFQIENPGLLVVQERVARVDDVYMEPAVVA